MFVWFRGYYILMEWNLKWCRMYTIQKDSCGRDMLARSRKLSRHVNHFSAIIHPTELEKHSAFWPFGLAFFCIFFSWGPQWFGWNASVGFFVALMRAIEKIAFFLREYVHYFPFPQIVCTFSKFLNIFPIFSKDFPDFLKNRVCLNFEEILREYMKCENNYVNAWNLGPIFLPLCPSRERCIKGSDHCQNIGYEIWR